MYKNIVENTRNYSNVYYFLDCAQEIGIGTQNMWQFPWTSPWVRYALLIDVNEIVTDLVILKMLCVSLAGTLSH